MPKYLFQAQYTADGVKGLLSKGGSARRAAAQAMAESVGGSLEAFYFAFGTTDGFAIVELPDNSAAAAMVATSSTSRINPVAACHRRRPVVASRHRPSALKATAEQPPVRRPVR